MPSVAELCEEMAQQRRWIFDAKTDPEKDDGGGARAAEKAREREIFGRGDRSRVEETKLYNHKELDRTDFASKVHFILLLVGKVFVGKSLQ